MRAAHAACRCSSAATGVAAGARAARAPSRASTSSSATTACSTSRWRATSRSACSTTAAPATAGCCRPGRCASRCRARCRRPAACSTTPRAPTTPLPGFVGAAHAGRRGRARRLVARRAAERRRARGAARPAAAWRPPAWPGRSASSTCCATPASTSADAAAARPPRLRDAALAGRRPADVVVTEKDAVKLDPARRIGARVWVAALDFEPEPAFDDALLALLPPPPPARLRPTAWTPDCLNCSSARSARGRCSTGGRRCTSARSSSASADRLAFPVRDGIPVMLESEARAAAGDDDSTPPPDARPRLAFTVLIPARLASTRLPDKPLADIGGLPMVVRVARRARAVGGAPRRGRRRRRRRSSPPARAHGVEAVLTARRPPERQRPPGRGVRAARPRRRRRSSSTCRATSR